MPDHPYRDDCRCRRCWGFPEAAAAEKRDPEPPNEATGFPGEASTREKLRGVLPDYPIVGPCEAGYVCGFARGRASRDPEVAELRAEVERLRKLEIWREEHIGICASGQVYAFGDGRVLRALLADETKKGESDG